MSTSLALRPPRTGGALNVALAIAAVVVLVRLTGAHDSPALETFVLILTSIVVEALPFVLLGALVSALIEVYVPERFLTRIAAMPVRRQLPLAALGGFAFPVCECGSVPVARRLIAKGVHPSAGLAFMLASPVLNPVVLASTVVAYAGRGLAWEMTLGRAGLGLVLAMAAGWALGTDDAKKLLRPRPDDQPMVPTDDQPMLPTADQPMLPTADQPFVHTDSSSKRTAFVNHLAADFFFMGRFVVIGAALAAAMQTVIPQSIVSGIARTPIIGSLALMAIAFVLSLCSEADAFVAVSFTQFPLGSQLAFLVFGPVVDAKLAFLYGATFRRRFVMRLVVISVPIVLAGSLWFEALVVPR